jgi:sarcosine oxidase
MRRFETIVLGLGAMGSAALLQLARKGNAVLGIDQHSPPHALGSTHGDTRITRLAIGEGEQYTPLVLRSHELWRELEAATGETLLTTRGGLIISSSAKTSKSHVEDFFANTVAAARKYGIAHELLDASEIKRRFPQFKVAGDEHGYLERDAGFLRPEACVRAQLNLAAAHGAEIHTGERALGFDPSGSEVTVTTEQGTYAADFLVVTAGPWLSGLLQPELARPFEIYRQVLFWFDLENDANGFLAADCPVFIWELQAKPQGIYGFPAIDGPRGGVKIATEEYRGTTTPDGVDRVVSGEEARAMYANYVAPYVSGVTSRCLRTAVCLYTVTPDFGFVIDAHPHSERVLVASPCSGHGFKHSAAIGEALAELAVEGAARHDLSSFSFARFLGDQQSPTR